MVARAHWRLISANAVGIWFCLATTSFAAFVNFETAPVHPVSLGPDGCTLAVCNLPDGRVELFDVSSGVPVPAGSISVGLDPVTARFASANELWVVNHISASISIVDIAAQNIVATLETLPGPSDVVFAGNPRRAWVSCSRTNAVLVFDLSTRTVVTNIAIEGERPRGMASSPDGSRVYVAIFESGNGTTILGRRLTEFAVPPQPGPVEDINGPHGGVDPPPNSGTNFFPAINSAYTNRPPRVSHIVRKNSAGRWRDDNGGDWTEWISGTNAPLSGRIPGWDLPDHDVAIIDTATLKVSYVQRLMNICMAIAVNPVSGQVAVVGTDATNERRFEPVLKGVFLRVNLALVDPLARTNRLRDLNPHLDYVKRTLPPEGRALSLGDPRGIEWSSDGTRAYITGMGSRNLVIVDAEGNRVNPQPIELGEGPTGMALDEARARLYVWNHFSSTLSVVDTTAGTVTTNLSVFDPTPEIVRKGRRHLYDTRKTSGLGIVSCASCHVNARFDRLAWDLGDPAGKLVTNDTLIFHPMKGPLVTQTLQDIITPTFFKGGRIRHQPLHWRGDRKNIEEFNPTFKNLLASDAELTTNEMAEFKQMLASIFFPPNFLRTFSNTLPAVLPLPGHFGRVPTNGDPRQPLPPGNPQAAVLPFTYGGCSTCHNPDQGRGVQDFSVDARNGTEGAFKTAQLRSLLDKVGMDGLSTNSRAGFGFMHDGRVDTLSRFLEDGFDSSLVPTDQDIADMIALLLCFTGSDLLFPNFFDTNSLIGAFLPSQDVPAATGRQITLASATEPPLLSAMFSLALQTTGRVELIVRGRKDGQSRSWLLRPGTQDFLSDRNGEIVPTLADLIAWAAPQNEFTATLVPRGTGMRLALDRDGDGYFNLTELEMGTDPADAQSHPSSPIVSLRLEPFVIRTEAETCRLIVQAKPQVTSIRVPNNFILHQGTLHTNLQLFDDGTHGDAIGGDHFFTIDQVSFDLANDPFFAGQPLITTSYTIESAIFTYDDGTTETVSINHPLTVRLIRSEHYAPPRITALGPGAQRSDYCLNLVVAAAPTNYNFDVSSVTHRYYEFFPDDRHFLVIEDAFQRPWQGLAGSYVSVINTDRGFGVEAFDSSVSFGSSGKLQGYIRTFSALNPGLLNHELLHRWAAFLDDLGLSAGSHWRAILRPSSGFGPSWGAYKEFRFVSGRTYRALFNSTGYIYSDFELYLMGLLPSANVAWPIQYLVNATPLSAGFDPITQTQYQDFAADGIGEVSLAQVVAQYGERTPAPPAAQTRFKLGTIVVYDRPLSEVELTYYDMFAREYSKPSTTWSNFTGFGSATGDRAEMSTLLPTCLVGIRLERLGNGQVLVSWPLPECGYMPYRSTTLNDWTPLPPPYQIAVRSQRAEFFQLRRPPDADLLAYYTFEGTADDLTGNSPPMELRNTTFTNGTLYLNGIYEFTGNTNGFHASARIIGFSYQSFTVALDFFAADFSDGNILTGGRSSRWFSLRHNAGRLEVTLNHQALTFLIPNSRLKTNQWQSVTCSVDASAKKIITFLDGQRLGDIALSPGFEFEVVGTPYENTDRVFTFANYSNGSAFHGYADNLKVWARALSASEIEAMLAGSQIPRAVMVPSPNGY